MPAHCEAGTGGKLPGGDTTWELFAFLAQSSVSLKLLYKMKATERQKRNQERNNVTEFRVVVT